MINLFEGSSGEESALILSEKEKSLGFILADVEHFDMSQPDYFEQCVIYILSESDAIFKTFSEITGRVVYSHRRWGSKDGDDDFLDWSPISSPIDGAEDSIAHSSPKSESGYYTIERKAFRYSEVKE
jgi:hypothetical protein